MVTNLYEMAERAIIDRLQVLNEIRIEGYPDDSKQLGRATPTARILVGYQSSTFRVVSEEPVTVEETLTFEITLALKGLRTYQGAYPFLSQIKMLLIGFVPVRGDVRPMRPRSVAFKNAQDGIWFYSMSFIFPVMLTSPRIGSYTPIPTPVFEPVFPITPGDGINLIPPDAQVQIKTGLWRSTVGHLKDEKTLDRLFLVETDPPAVTSEPTL